MRLRGDNGRPLPCVCVCVSVCVCVCVCVCHKCAWAQRHEEVPERVRLAFEFEGVQPVCVHLISGGVLLGKTAEPGNERNRLTNTLTSMHTRTHTRTHTHTLTHSHAHTGETSPGAYPPLCRCPTSVNFARAPLRVCTSCGVGFCTVRVLAACVLPWCVCMCVCVCVCV